MQVSILYRYPINTNFRKRLYHVIILTMNIRKIGCNSQGTYYVTLPKELVHKVKFRKKQKVIIKEYGEGILIEDWKDDK